MMEGLQMHQMNGTVTVPSDHDGYHNGENGIEIAQKSFKERLDELPVYAMTITQLYNIYSSIRDRNETLKKAFNTGEYYIKALAETAKPVVVAATNSALATAKPLIGEVTDPVGTLDCVASEVLAKVGEKFPVIRKRPLEIAESTKNVIANTATSYYEKLYGTTAGKTVHQQVDNVISLSELMVELCFPTDGSCKEDVEELDQAEEDESKGALVRVTNLKNRLTRRGTKKLMTMKTVQVSCNAVHYAQERIVGMNKKLNQGSNYSEGAQIFVYQTSDLLKDKASGIWDKVYSTTMYIPNKAIQVGGEVYISAKDIVFAFTRAHSVTEMPHAVVEMAEKYYDALKINVPDVSDVADTAVDFVMVPTEVVSEHILSSRPVQWIIPNIMNADEDIIMEDIQLEDLEREMQQSCGEQ